MSEYGDSFLLAPFREFYAEVIRLKQMVSVGPPWVSPPSSGDAEAARGQRGTWVYFPDAIAEAGSDDVARITAHTWTPPPAQESTTALVRADQKGDGNGSSMDFPDAALSNSYRVSTMVWHRLASLFQQQAVTAWRYGGTYGEEFYREAQYVMVALADDIFLHTDWDGKTAWVSNLLESKIFRTHVAGELIFEKIEDLLREQNPVNKDLAAVYLMALSLGFKGKYYRRNDRGQIARYRQQLFAFICRRDPDLDDPSRFVFPEAYYQNVREGGQKKLSDPRKWLLVLFLVIVVYTSATHAVWVEFTRGVNTVNQSISKLVSDLKTPPRPR